jgi:DHA2 family multidrug resistance protein
MIATAERAPPALTGGLLILGGFVLAMANFMAVLDTNIANVAMPHIAGSLAASPQEGTSVITFYAIAEAICIPLTGWLAMRFGAVKVFLTAIAGFGVTSAFCGLAPTLELLIVFRLLQGFAAGPMMPLAQTLLMQIVPQKHHTIALGLFAMTIILGPIAGPLVGGVIADTVGWEWSFFINVPIAIFLLMVGGPLLTPQETKTAKTRVDVVGLFLLVTWVGALQLMLDTGKEHDWFQSSEVVTMAIVSAIGFAAFVIWELTEKAPIVELRIFRNASFTIATGVMSLTFAIFIGSLVLVPLWLQTNMGYSATTTGQIMAFNGVLGVIAAPLTARLMAKVDGRAIACFGLLAFASVMGARTLFNAHVAFDQMIGAHLFQGGSMPLFVIPLMTIALAQIPQKDMAAASGLMTFTRTIAGAVGASVVTSFWSNSTIAMRNELVNGMDTATAATAISASGAPGYAVHALDAVVQSESVMLATNQMFAFVMPALIGAALLVWLTPKPPTSAAMPDH